MDFSNSELYFLSQFFTDQQKSRKEIHSLTQDKDFFYFSQICADYIKEKILLRCYLCIFSNIICDYSHVAERSNTVKKQVQQMAVSMQYIYLIKN